MNEIILTGIVCSKTIKSKATNTSTIYLKVRNTIKNKYDFVPVSFRCIDHDLLIALKDKEIAVSGHVEASSLIKIYADVIKICK